MEFRERIKNLRSKKDFTLEEVGNKIGVSRQTMHRYESGAISNIPSDKIEALADLYNVSPAYLMGWEDEPHSITSEFLSLCEADQSKVLEYIEFLKNKAKKG